MKSKNYQKNGTSIIRVAAFAFALVSWKATAEGLREYVFSTGWEAALISFAIQSMLFVFNLKLPFYINRMGKVNKTHPVAIPSVYQIIIVAFYIMVLCSSSFFSFVYICNTVVYKHQSGYVDDNTILMSSYRRIADKTIDYISEKKKETLFLASDILSELKTEYPSTVGTDNKYSLEELKVQLEEAQSDFNVAKEELEIAKNDVEAAKKNSEYYAGQAASTKWHYRQDTWEEKHEEANQEYQRAVEVRNEKEKAYNEANKALKNAKAKVDGYKKSEDTLVSEFLLEMLKPSPDSHKLNNYINDLNALMLSIGEGSELPSNYSDLIVKTEMLTSVINDYICLTSLESNEQGIQYLSANIYEEIVIPNPSSPDFDESLKTWETIWTTKLDALEHIIQQLPSYNNNMVYRNDLVNKSLLAAYDASAYMDLIDDLRRSKVSDINVIEKVSNLLTGKYYFTACFSMLLAIFFDLSSLMAGLFLYGLQKNKEKGIYYKSQSVTAEKGIAAI